MFEKHAVDENALLLLTDEALKAKFVETDADGSWGFLPRTSLFPASRFHRRASISAMCSALGVALMRVIHGRIFPVKIVLMDSSGV